MAQSLRSIKCYNVYTDGLDSRTLTVDRKPDDIVYIKDISEYNISEGLALSSQEEDYLRQLSEKLGRPLTDSEVFGFSQVNSGAAVIKYSTDFHNRWQGKAIVTLQINKENLPDKSQRAGISI